MLEESIKEYFSKEKWQKNRYSIFESKCEDDGCKLNGNFKDYIINNITIKKLKCGDNLSQII